MTRKRASGFKGKVLYNLMNTVLFSTTFPNIKKKKAPKVPAVSGIHCSVGVHGIVVLALEWCFPLHRLVDEKTGRDVLDAEGRTVPDITIARDLVWAAKDLFKEYTEKHQAWPYHIPLEFRIIRGCDTKLTIGNGVDFVVCIEVLTWRGSESMNQLYREFSQLLTDRWIQLIVDNNPNDLKYCRPHWAKYFQFLTVRGEPIMKHLKFCYEEDLKAFNEIRKEADPNNMFLNNMFAQLFDESK